MNVVYQRLAERIRGELEELDRLVARVYGGWSRAMQMPEEDMFLDAVALNLHGFYSGVERLFELIAQRVDQAPIAGQMWHHELIQRMAQDIDRQRPAVISRESVAALDELRRFRHLVRNIYATNLVPEKLAVLVDLLQITWPQLRAELMAFAAFLDDLAAVDD